MHVFPNPVTYVNLKNAISNNYQNHTSSGYNYFWPHNYVIYDYLDDYVNILRVAIAAYVPTDCLKIAELKYHHHCYTKSVAILRYKGRNLGSFICL